jgi:hypothetical protein
LIGDGDVILRIDTCMILLSSNRLRWDDHTGS